VITAIVGAALRNDYSHIVNAISELISNGAPNKAILDVVFNIYNALLLAFAIGAYVVSKNAPRLCRIAMGMFIAVQVLSFSWGFFPMDPMGTEATFAGTMHNILGGVVALVTIIMPLLMGLGLRRLDGFQRYAKYSFISSAIIFVSGLTGVILAGQGVQLFGLFERITIGSYEAWIFVTALNLLKIREFE
jgi:fumarate reductase subunit D